MRKSFSFCVFAFCLSAMLVYSGCTGVAGSPSNRAPLIRTQPTSQMVTAGQPASFSVAADGTAPLLYQWLKDGTAIAGAISSSYTTPPTTTGDNGLRFSVTISDTAGSVTSNSATLTVTAADVAPSFTTQPASQTIVAGQTATFSVTASGTAPLSYQWSKNGTAISGAVSSTYTTPAETASDSGAQFSVVVTNSVGTATSNGAVLTVNPAPVAPSITTQPSSQSITAGQTATFSVTALGTAPLNYQWRKNGTAVGANSLSYTTPAETASDSGAQFTVVISNSVGNVTSDAAILTVAPPAAPSITTQPLNQTVTAGQTATFSVTASGTSPLSYQWNRNGAVISGATSSTYTTPATSVSDNGTQFTVTITNSAGTTTSNTATLTVSTAPSIWRSGFYTDGAGQPISEVPWNKLTHLYLCCAAPATAPPFFTQNWLTPSNYPTLMSTAHANNVKVLLSIIDLSGAFYPTATTPGNVDTFVATIVNYVNTNGFDGVDLDWENSIIESQYVTFISKLRTALPTELITMDVGEWGGMPSVAASAHPNLDKINVMCYDMASYSGVSWYNDAIHNNGTASLASCEARVGAFTTPSVGVPNSQIIVGIPAYGYVWNGTTVAGVAGATFNSTQYAYNQIVTNATWWNGGANKNWDNVYGSDYLSVTSTNQFLTYNDSDSVSYIVNWGNSQGYGGYYILFLYQEYMSSLSGDAKYPLTAALYAALSGVP